MLDYSLYGQVILYCKFNHICQVILTLLRILFDAMQGIPQPICLETICTYVQFLDLTLVMCSHIFLNDGFYSAIGFSYDAPKATRIVCNGGHQAQRSRIEALGFEESIEYFAAQQGHICIGYNHVIRFTFEQRFGLNGRMPCSKLGFLQNTICRISEIFFYLIRAMTYNDHRPFCRG